MTPKTFSEVAIGESFTHRGKSAIKISGNRYRFATDAPDSPHRLLAGTRAEYLIAIARNDDSRAWALSRYAIMLEPALLVSC